ncbi:hypothetical protein RHMOL_Rhmol01G0061400 [Rhododendron molle]|uniref:Uncharacterized protein n=1 Tax=Rhododendron molle TaxID=49168 RepID=A0ACC0PYH2_RHOML|nr:hypothetical protein RHMOL_Rhmol01G0061400 [Rhododendron molle]
MLPPILLSCKLSLRRLEEKLTIDPGNTPPKLLLGRVRVDNLVAFVNEFRKLKSSTSPVPSLLSFVKEPSSKGIFPANLLPESSRATRLEQLDILDGISPIIELLTTVNFCSLRKRLSSGGIS